MLDDFYLPTRANQTWKYSGIDSPDQCRDWSHFDSYPHTVEYRFNSRGFRDAEWPEDPVELYNAVWCVGDSFTVGLGAPVEHTWPYILAQKTNLRTINVSMDGASNDWISRRIMDICDQVSPRFIVAHWSYIERRESTDTNLTDEQRRLWHVVGETEGLFNLTDHIKCVETNPYSNVIHSTIPNFTSNEIGQKLLLKKHAELYISHFDNLDYSRDGWHYDVKTATMFAEKLTEIILTK
jgi:hypothetical protein